MGNMKVLKEILLIKLCGEILYKYEPAVQHWPSLHHWLYSWKFSKFDGQM